MKFIIMCLSQVLSETVSKALELTGGEEAKETAKFVGMFDKFFDCLNVNSFTQGKYSRKAFQNPYRKATDFRLKVCTYIYNIYYRLNQRLSFLRHHSGWSRNSFLTWMSGKQVYKGGKASLGFRKSRCY